MRVALLAAILVLCGCGGGGGSSPPTGPPQSLTFTIEAQYGVDANVPNTVEPIAQWALLVDGAAVATTSRTVLTGVDTSHQNGIIETATVALAPGPHTISISGQITGEWFNPAGPQPTGSDFFFTLTSPVVVTLSGSGINPAQTATSFSTQVSESLPAQARQVYTLTIP